METRETDDLEGQQYQQLYWEEDLPLADVRKNVLRKFVYIGGVLCLLFLAIGLFVKFPDQVELPFVLKNNQSEQIYRFSHPVYVMERYVKPQDVVAKGQKMVRITSPEIVALVNSFREAEQGFHNFFYSKVPSIEKEKRIIVHKIRQYDVELAEALNELAILDNTWKSNLAAAEEENAVASKRFEIFKKQYEEKAGSLFELLEYEARKTKAADALETAKQNYARSKFNLTSLYNKYQIGRGSAMEELQKITIDRRHDSASLQHRYASAKNRIENTFGDVEIAEGDLILKAGGEGVVGYIFDGEKEVATGAILLKVIHSKTHFYAWIKSPPSQVGKLAVNKKVVLKVASFPFYEWGTLKGHIEHFSLTPDELGNFSVKVTIDNFGRLKNLLQIGMNGNAAIILEERTFYYYFFRDAKRIYSNLTNP